MDQGEVLRTPHDRCQNLPSEQGARALGRNPRPPVIWSRHRVVDIGPVLGQFPVGFLEWVYGVLCLRGNENVLHVCSGALGPDVRGVRVDIRAAVVPDVVADGRALPFADDTFDAVLIDPPYSVEYAKALYETDYPRPSALLREAARVLRPGRRVGIVHFLVPGPVDGLRFVEVHGVTTGCGYRIRALTVYEKEQRSLFWRLGCQT
jgi:SAM-dependent methyltransferase